MGGTGEGGVVSAPGYCTPSEAFRAIRAGAHALKLFPAEAASPKVVKAQRAVWPSHIHQIVVGGVTTDTMADYLAAGADGFGLGSSLYRQGQSADQVIRQASACVPAIGHSTILDRKIIGSGKRESDRGSLGGRRSSKKKQR